MRRYDLDRLDQRSHEALERFCAVLQPVLWRYFRPQIRGFERVPQGAALYVGNHNGGLLIPDTFVLGIALFRELGEEHVPYGLGHEIAISIPLLHQLVVPLGAVRASHENAHRLFSAGKKAVVYPGGDYEAMRSYWRREKIDFGPRRGYLKLAIRAGVPIVPVVTAGAHETFLVLDEGRWLAKLLRLDKLLRLKMCPISLSIPWGLTVGPMLPHLPLPSHMFMELLEPITFERSGEAAAADTDYLEACNNRVVDRMQRALTRLSAERVAAGGKLLL